MAALGSPLLGRERIAMAEHITHLRLVSIPVADVDRAKAFYVDVLGFEERFDGPFGEGMRWVELAPPDAQASIALVTWFTGEVREDPWGTSASFVDPDGNGWVLMQTPAAAA
jgi:catechol 2,3-dioxygenase-like lactoylglutathione lyase family enzyme